MVRQMASTLKDIAKACNVSYSTVSKALKNSPLVKPETKLKIQNKAREMNYIPNHSARSLVSKKSGTIGLIWPALDRVAVNELIIEINNYLKKFNYVMLVSIDDPKTASEKFLEYRCDGIIVFDEGSHTTLSEYVYKNIPVVAYGAQPDLPYPIVNPNHKDAMILAINSLIRQGYKNIDYIGHLNINDTRQILKKDTFIKYCRMNDVNFRLIDTGSLNTYESEKEIKKFLTSQQLSNAVVTGTFDITVALLNALTDKKDIKIISYDNIPQVATLDYKVSSVGVPTNIIAKNIVELLTQYVDGKKIDKTVYLKPVLEENE